MVGAAVKSGQVHGHPQAVVVGKLHLLVRQELMDAALGDVSGDRVGAVGA